MGCCSSQPSKVVVPMHKLEGNTINPQRSVISKFVQTNDNLPSLEHQNRIINQNSDQKVSKTNRSQFEVQKINLNPLTIQKRLLENKEIQVDLEQQQQRISLTIQEAKQQISIQKYQNNQHKPDVQLQINNLKQQQFSKKISEKKVINKEILKQSSEIKNKQQHISQENQITNRSINNQEEIDIIQVDQFHVVKDDKSMQNTKLQTISLQFRQNIINLQRSQGNLLFIKLKKIEFEDKKKSYEKKKQLIDSLEIKIINQSLDLNQLMSYAEQNNIEVFDLLISYNQDKQSILELIILYIDNYQIIQYFLLNYQFSFNIFLNEIGNTLFNKIKPFLKDTQKIQMTVDFIFQVRKSSEIAKIMWQIDFQNLLSYLNLKDKLHLKFLKLIAIILSENQIDQSFLSLYQEMKKSLRFTQLKIPKFLAKGKSDVKIADQLMLPQLSFNIFHQVALDQKWDIFLQYNNAYYYKSNISQKTPFMLMFQLAPLKTINEYLQKYESSLFEGINYSQDNGYNLLHCLCRNKYIHLDQSEIQILFTYFQKYPQILKKLQLQPYHDQIPLIYYLDFQKKPQPAIIEFLASYLKDEINQPIFEILKFFQNTQIQNHEVKERQQKHNVNQLKKGKEKQQQQLNIREKFFIFKVQLAKQIIKHQFLIQISHITDIQLFISNLLYWSCFPTFSIAHNFMAIPQEQVKMKYLKQFFKIQQQLQLDINFYYQNLLILIQFAEKDIQQLLVQEINLIIQKNPQISKTQEVQKKKNLLKIKEYTKSKYFTSFFYKEKFNIQQNIKLVDQNGIILHTFLQNITLEQCTKLYDCQYNFILDSRYDKQFQLIKFENLNLIPQNYKQKVVIHQIKTNLKFIECILLFSECQQDFQKIDQEAFSSLILQRSYLFKHIKTISQNDSLSNVIYFLQMEEFKDYRNIFSFLIELTKQYFRPFTKEVYKLEDKKDFNVQLQKICSKLSQSYSFTLPPKNESEEALRLLFDNIDQESFFMLVSYDCKVFSTKLQRQPKLQIAMLDKLFTTFQSEEYKLGFEKYLTQEATKYYFDEIVSNIELWHLLPFHLNDTLRYQLNQIFDTEPQNVITYYIIFNSKIKEIEFPLHLYSKALKQRNENNLLKILKNLKVQKLKNFFIQVIYDQQQFENYVLALKFPPCLVLNLDQFIKFLEVDQTDQQKLLEYLQLCLKSGLYEKIELILKKLGAFRSLQQKEIILENITNIMLLDKQSNCLSKLLSLYLQPEKKYCELQNYCFFQNSIDPYTYQRKREKQKQSDSKLLDLAIKNIEKKQFRCVTQKDVVYKFYQQEKELKTLLFQQASQYGKQNQIINCQFQPKVVSQKQNFSECYKSIRNWIGNHKVSEVSQKFELVYSLIQPEKQKIGNKTELLRVLAQSLEKKVITIKNIHEEKLKAYLALIKLNCDKNFKSYFSQDFSLRNLDLNTCLIFIDELIIDKLIYTPTSNELEYIIFYLKIQNKSLIPILKSNFLGCQMFYYKSQRLKFTSASLFYLKNGINLLPNDKYYFYGMRQEKEVKKVENKIKVLSNHISDSGLYLSILTPCQVYILYRGENHIIQKPNFDQSFVLLAFLSGSIETLEYVLNLSDNPFKLVNEQKIFQLLIMYRFNETAIINFYQKFVQNHPSNDSDLIFQGYPLLYYIIEQKFEQVFFQCYLPIIKKKFGNNAQGAINDQLSFKILEDLNVLQLALQKKCYFILNFCNDIIQSQYIVQTQIYFDIQILYLQNQQKQNDLRQQFLLLYSNHFKQNKLSVGELIQFEKACLCSIFQFDFDFQLKNHQLSIRLKQNKWKELKILKSDPNLLSYIIKEYELENGNYNIDDELYSEIIKNSLNQPLTHPIYQKFAQIKIKKFFALIIELEPFLLTLPLVIQLFYLIKSEDLGFFFIEISKIKQNDPQNFMFEIIFSGFLLYSIHTNEYQISVRNFNISTLSKIYQQLLNLDLINQQTKKPYFTVSSEKYLMSYLKPNILFQDLDILKNILEDELSQERAIVIGIMHIIKINKIVEEVIEKINQSRINFQQKLEFNQKFIIFIGQGYASYRKDEDGVSEFTLPIEYLKNSFFIQQECIKQIIELLKIEIFNLNIDEELTNFMKIAEDFIDYDLSSITTIMQEEYIAQSESQTGLYEKCFFFRHLLEEQFTQSGIYKIYDQSAPHYERNQDQMQNENIKPIVQNLQDQIYDSNKNNQKLNFQKQQSLINKQQRMKEDFQFMLELLPDNTYQVRSSKFTNNSKKLIFTEFYHFQQPYVIVNLEQLSQQEFQAKYNIQTIVTYIISDLYQYNQFLGCLLEEKKPFQWTIKFPFYIQEQKFQYQKELFSTYQIQSIQSRMFEFIENLFLIVERKNLESQFEWRINLISFFEVFILKLSALKKNSSNSVQHLIEQILNWDTFIIILQQILFNTIINEHQLLKVIRCVYVEFTESVQKFNPNSNQKGLDEIFQFHKTNYLLYNNVLIVRFNVAISSLNEIKEIIQKEQKNTSRNMNPNQENEILIKIVNRFDFYSQIFNHEQLVFYFFNKFEIDQLLLSYSKKMSQMLKKRIIISVDHSSLAEIFSDEILSIGSINSDFERQKKLQDIQYILQKLKDFIEEELFVNLENQFKSQIVLKHFEARLLSLNKAIKNKIPFNKIVQQNNFILGATESIKLLSDQILLECNQICMFGFQVSNEYYLSISQLGDLLIKFEKYNSIQQYQLVYKFTSTQFLFYQLSPSKAELSMEEILKNQNKYMMRNFDKNYVEIYAPLQAIILLKQKWPEDETFNSQIKNVFYVDQTSYLHYVSENMVPKKIKELLLEKNEVQKQEHFNQIFCLEDLEGGITLEKILNLFPNEINFRFSSNNQLKKQKQVVSSQFISIKIIEDKFKIDPLPMKQVSTACYFQSHPNYQPMLKKFLDFVKIKKELPEIQIIFDDQLDKFSLLACDIILDRQTIFDEFIKGYQLFLDETQEPILENSIQILFGKQSILQLKKEFIAKAIKKIEFIFLLSQEQNPDQIIYQDQQLRLYTIINEQGKLSFPFFQTIVHQLNQIIIDFEKFQLSEIITEKNFSLKLTNNINNENRGIICELILISRYFYQIYSIIWPQQKLIISILSSKELQVPLLRSFYQFYQQDQLFIDYNKFEDFDFSNFFLDCLNNKSHFKADRYYNKLIYVGPQIIQENFSLYPIKYLQGQKNLKQIQVTVFDAQFGELKNCKELVPKNFHKVYLIFKENETFVQFQAVISLKNPLIQGYITQQSMDSMLSQSNYLLIKDLKYRIPLKQQLDNIKWKDDDNNFKLSNIDQSLSMQSNIGVQQLFITNNLLLIEINSNKVVKIRIHSKTSNLSYKLNSFTSKIEFQFFSNLEQDLTKTIHYSTILDGEEQFLIGGSSNKSNNSYQNDFSIRSILENVEDEDTIFYDQTNLASLAGQERIDSIQFRDNERNKILNYKYQKAIFVHKNYKNIQYIPKEIKEEQVLKLVWNPTIKGSYDLFIDDFNVAGAFIVLANVICVQFCEVQLSQLFFQEVQSFQDLPFGYILRDKYKNEYEDIDYNYKEKVEYDVKTDQQDIQIVHNLKEKKIGKINGILHFEVPNDSDYQKKSFQIDFIIEGQIIKSQNIVLTGLSLEKRKENLSKDLNIIREKFYPKYKEFKRINFFSELLQLVETKLNDIFEIKFQDERGSDMGGLRREFYDMIGKILKDKKYNFFSPVSQNQSQYFLNKNFNRIRNKEEYALLFGKLIANSIVNNEIIGIDIIDPFWKVLFDEKIVVEDLNFILDASTFKNYLDMRKQDYDFEIVCANFTIQVGNQEIELIPNGKNIEVTKNNVEIYLQKTAEYLIHLQFKEIYERFKQGFDSLLDIKILKKWLQPQEISLVTNGLSEITAEVIFKKVRYMGETAIHKSYFENFCSQADSELLRNMLKFITGSSVIPYEQSDYYLQVEFTPNLKNFCLPVTHTCFKKIEIPLYESFGQFKQKLEIAISHGLVGFGMV